MRSLEYAARSVLLAGFAGPVVPSWLVTELDRGLGGVCLYGNNLAAGHRVTELAQQLRDLAPRAVLAIDEEGGDVTRLHTRSGSPYAGPAVLGRHDDPAVTTAVAAGIGAELAGAGIWLDLAPCADVNSDPQNPVIGTRSFGADPQLVARHTEAFITGLANSGVAASVKHFPGHGDTHADSHLELPTVRASEDVLTARELVPFRAAVAAGAPTVMTSHIVVSAVDPGQPATFSRVVLQDLLRGQLGFDGVVVTDALDMGGAADEAGIPGAAVRSLAAGADLLCLGPEPVAGSTPAAASGSQGAAPGAQVVEQVVAAITEAVASGHLPRQRLTDAAERVAALRQRWAPVTEPPDAAAVVTAARESSARAARQVLAEVPRLPDHQVLHIDTESNLAIGDAAWGLPGSSRRVAAVELPGTPLPDQPTLVVVRRATAQPEVWHWVRAALTQRHTWLVEVGWPDPVLAEHDRVICTYGASAASTSALAMALGRTP